MELLVNKHLYLLDKDFANSILTKSKEAPISQDVKVRETGDERSESTVDI